MKEIICLSNEPWSATPGRTQQLVTRLRDARILYFSPAASMRDATWRKPGRKVRPNLTVFTLPPVTVQNERLEGIFRLGQQRLGRFIQEQADRCRFHSPLLWTCCPAHVHLLDQLEYSGLVYDCDREWTRLPAHWEGALAHAADVVFVASPELRERLSPCSSNIALLPNGVNFPLFSGEREGEEQRRDPFPGLYGPILGWAGTIHADLDLSPLVYAAQARPRWTFLLLGDRSSPNPWLARLRRLPNVILQDRCPLTEVPEFLWRCDVLLNFLRKSRPYSDVIPGRIYEYLSTGKPIVSMLWPDQVERFPDVIYAAHSPEELVRLCDCALAEDRRWVYQRRQNYGARAAWSLRTGEVQRILDTAGLL
jgi:glycosyltransferase involved in cell wall biosynthesis